MNRMRKYLIACILLVIVVIVFWKQPTMNDKPTVDKVPSQTTIDRTSGSASQPSLGNVPPVRESLTQAEIERVTDQNRLQQMQEQIKKDYHTPIDFWGRVVDQDGRSLSNVKAEIMVDEYAANKKYVVFSDEDGLFELLGKRGSKIRIKVFLDGYAPTFDEKIGSKISGRTIYYAAKAMPAYAPPTKDNPQVFVLRKQNSIANLVHVKKKHISISKTGVSQKININTGDKEVVIEVRCLSSSPVPFTYDKYDWYAEIKIAGGKLLQIKKEESVDAPHDGYQTIFKIEMPKELDSNDWSAVNFNPRFFWIKFNDGTYAKARIEVNTGRKHYVNTEIWYNLDGTNNFEQ